MYEEYDDIDQKSKLDFSLWKRLFKQVLPYKNLIILGVIAVVGTAFLETTIVNYIAKEGLEKFLDVSIKGNPAFVWFCLGIFGLIILEVVGAKLFIWCCSRLEMNLYRDLTSKVFEHLQELSYSFYDKYSVGWLLARTTSDTSRIGEIISWGLSDIIWAVFKLIFILIYMLSYSWKLSLIMLVVVPLLLVISIFFRRVIVKYFWRVRRLNSQVTSKLNEGIMGVKTSKSLVLEEKNLQAFSEVVNKYRRTSLKSTIFTTLYYQTIAVLAAVGIAAMSYFGGWEVINSAIDVATLYLFVSYSTQFFDPVLSIARITNQMKQAQVATSRVFNLLDVKTEIPDREDVIEKYGTYKNPKKENWEPLHGDIEFKDVSFAYSTGSGQKVLKNFNLKINQGMSVALVGETGAGKSTIVNLLCRFYEPTEGEILIDGKNYQDRSVGWLHANLGYVMQTPHLFSGTIMDNIRYGNRNATDEEVIAAAKAANAHEFISQLENGYDTEVGEGGNRLSQGQKQLVSFARAIVANPRILVLDEATSSIDTTTEAMIQSAITNLLDGRTSFIIAHRLSTITNSDMILVIRGGEITEKGTHQELLELKGYYYKLYTNQFVEEKMKEMNFMSK